MRQDAAANFSTHHADHSKHAPHGAAEEAEQEDEEDLHTNIDLLVAHTGALLGPALGSAKPKPGFGNPVDGAGDEGRWWGRGAKIPPHFSEL